MLVSAVALLAAGVLAGLYYLRTSPPADAYFNRLPMADAVLVKVDVAALRSAGVLDRLAGSAAAQENEYLRFVSQTGFDYRKDLDLVYASFQNNRSYYLLWGRFDWQRLLEYAQSQGGNCLNTYCSVPGSAPDRIISFFPLQPALMAMAVSPDPSEAYLLQGGDDKINFEPPSAPVWFRLPTARVAGLSRDLPISSLAGLLGDAHHVDLTLDGGLGGVDVELQVQCRSPENAQELATRLKAAAGLLANAASGKGDGPSLLASLGKGAFSQDGTQVRAAWNLPLSVLDSLTVETTP